MRGLNGLKAQRLAIGLALPILAACALSAEGLPTATPERRKSISTPSPSPTKAEPAAPTPSVTEPREPAGVHEPETRVGIPEVDRAIEVMLAGDVEEMRGILAFTRAECTQQEGLGGPPKCREGEAEGTTVEVFPFLGPEGAYLRLEELSEWPGLKVSGLHAVYRVSDAAYAEPYFPAGEYGLVFLGSGGAPPILVRVTEAGVVRIDTLLGETPHDLLEREAEEILLSPPS